MLRVVFDRIAGRLQSAAFHISSHAGIALIDRLDKHLIAWMTTLDFGDVTLAAPGPAVKGGGIRVHLWEIVEDPPPRGMTRPPLQLILRYLITINDADPLQAHRVLGDLIVHAVQRAQANRWTLDFPSLPAAIWSAFGTAPQPSFVLCIPLRHEWDPVKVPRVTQPPELAGSPSTHLVGQVLGPNHIPIAGARLELRSLGLVTETAGDGRFRFASVPAGKHFPKQVVVTAKGQQQTIHLSSDSADKQLIIDFEMVEV